VTTGIPRALRYASTLLRRLLPAAHATVDEPAARRVSAVVTEYRHNTRADVIVRRLLPTDTLDGKGRGSPP
jgi:hypothetical protein